MPVAVAAVLSLRETRVYVRSADAKDRFEKYDVHPLATRPIVQVSSQALSKGGHSNPEDEDKKLKVVG